MRNTLNTALLQKKKVAARSTMPRLIWNRKVYNCVHTITQFDPILSRRNPVRKLRHYLRFILIVSLHLRLLLSGGIFPSDFPHLRITE